MARSKDGKPESEIGPEYRLCVSLTRIGAQRARRQNQPTFIWEKRK